ncbi:MAG: hypothetical protein KIG87_01130, partial [Muribaculaceae bacterium]|nr:hypothetical protein [Muribaculaceae bacterium]
MNSIEDVEDKSPLEVDCKDSDKSSMILMIWIVSLVASELLRWVHNFLPLDYSIRCGVLTGLNIIRYLLFLPVLAISNKTLKIVAAAATVSEKTKAAKNLPNR